jgi:Protein of unknown function
MIEPSELDQLILSFCIDRWRKVARIAGETLQALEKRGVQLDGTVAEQFDARIADLVGSGQLEAAGNIKKWRHSEVRLPGGARRNGEVFAAPLAGEGGEIARRRVRAG